MSFFQLFSQNCRVLCDFLHRIIASWLNQKINLTYQDFLEWWTRRFHSPLNMEKEFSEWIKGCRYHAPSNDPKALYTQKIAYLFHKNRGDYCFKLIHKTTSENTKTLVVYGVHQLQDYWGQFIQVFGKPVSVRKIE